MIAIKEEKIYKKNKNVTQTKHILQLETTNQPAQQTIKCRQKNKIYLALLSLFLVDSEISFLRAFFSLR
jgi:hypothetical protein